ncbi:MAG: bacteriohemerythrin [Candidatus Uhrbacteria bacterium]
MSKFIWTEQYSVGVKEIDEQHQHFFQITNEVAEIAEQNEITPSELLFKITNLSNYAVYHLLTEENIFKQYNYPEAEGHIAAHNLYREEMTRFIAEAEKPEADVKKMATEIADFAGAWLAGHIMMMDKQYAGFMHNNGIR